MASDGAIGRLRRYLRELKPSSLAMLAAELERAMMRGEGFDGASVILDELRRALRGPEGPAEPRESHPQRLFFAPLGPFLIEQSKRHYPGRVSRLCVDPVWDWLTRNLMPAEAAAYGEEVNILLASDAIAAAERAARTFQDIAVERLRETLAAARADEKVARRIAGQIGVPDALEELREIYMILRSRDALAVVASRLPVVIGNLGDCQLDNVKALLDSPVGTHQDVFLYALILVMGRLAAPWQLIRLAIRAAGSDAAVRIMPSPFALAVDVVVAELDRAIATARIAIRAGRIAGVVPLIKDIHDIARALHTELDLSGDLPWGRALATARSDIAALLQQEIETVPGRVRRLLRQRTGSDASRPLDVGDVDQLETSLDLFVACRTHAAELALSESTRRTDSELQAFFDTTTQILIDGLRNAGPAERPCRQSQVDAAVRFCRKLFGAEYAALLGKAAELARRGEPRTAQG